MLKIPPDSHLPSPQSPASDRPLNLTLLVWLTLEMYVCVCLAKENSVLQHLSPLLITAQQPIMTIRWDSVAKAYIKVTEEWGKRDLCASFLDWEAWMFIQSYGDFDWQTLNKCWTLLNGWPQPWTVALKSNYMQSWCSPKEKGHSFNVNNIMLIWQLTWTTKICFVTLKYTAKNRYNAGGKLELHTMN